MFNTFKYGLLVYMRTPGVVIWSLLFPIFMATIFMMMFTSLDESADVPQVSVVVVNPANTTDGYAFRSFVDAISENDDGILNVTYVDDAQEAKRLIDSSKDINSAKDALNAYVGYVELDNEGVPHTYIASQDAASGISRVQASILVLAMDNYVANKALVVQLMKDDPMTLANPGFIKQMLQPLDATQQVQLTYNQPKESVRYYFALIGMSAMFGASIGLYGVSTLQANITALGARRIISATKHSSMIAGALLSAWTVCFVCLLIAYAYMKFVVQVDFGNRDAACILAIAVSSLTAISMGCAISAIPKISLVAKNGIVSAIVCISALFAGLYGTFAMDLSNYISLYYPIAEIINPTTQIAQMFFSILYFDSFAPFLSHLIVLVCMSALFFLVSVAALRRTRYANL